MSSRHTHVFCAAFCGLQAVTALERLCWLYWSPQLSVTGTLFNMSGLHPIMMSPQTCGWGEHTLNGTLSYHVVTSIRYTVLRQWHSVLLLCCNNSCLQRHVLTDYAAAAQSLFVPGSVAFLMRLSPWPGTCNSAISCNPCKSHSVQESLRVAASGGHLTTIEAQHQDTSAIVLRCSGIDRVAA